MEKTKNLVNFRDLGGLKSADGRTVRPHKLLRSGELSQITPADVQFLQAHNLKYIIDFRSQHEIAKQPNVKIDGVQSFALDVLQDFTKGNPVNLAQFATMTSIAEIHAKLEEVYRAFVTTKTAQQCYRQFLVHLAQLDGGILFHCSAGKDRTGFAAMLILTILDVNPADIMADFIKSSKLRKKQNELLLENARKEGQSPETLEVLGKMLIVQGSYLNAATSTIVSEYGSFDNYVTNILHITNEQIQTIKNKYLG
ncbi:MAG: tyrosine-protein phosphatase [Defluviitaleaceae bacterium]|nr:tyrosine-protein phosphatase [Defluviitaleaceae bacterium]